MAENTREKMLNRMDAAQSLKDNVTRREVEFNDSLVRQLNQAAGAETYHSTIEPNATLGVSDQDKTFSTRTCEKSTVVGVKAHSVEITLCTPDHQYLRIDSCDFEGEAFDFSDYNKRTRRFPVINDTINAKLAHAQIVAWKNGVARCLARQAQQNKEAEESRKKYLAEQQSKESAAAAKRTLFITEARTSLEAQGFIVVDVREGARDSEYATLYVRVPSRPEPRYHGGYDLEIPLNADGADIRIPLHSTRTDVGQLLAKLETAHVL